MTSKNTLEAVNPTEKQIKNFWRKVDKNGPIHPYNPSLGNCWQWIGAKCSGGYGTFWCDGKVRAAHRISLRIAGLDLFSDKDVCHSCDHRFCVNPAHMKLGTTQDNIRDALARGRHISPCGEASGKSKLTDAKVREIRVLSAAGAKQSHLSKQFGVARSVIQSAVNRNTWKHVI